MGKLTCDLTCPKCHETWGRMRWEFEKPVQSSDVTVLAGKKNGNKKRTKLKNGQPLACTMCGHPMTNWDVILAIQESGKGLS